MFDKHLCHLGRCAHWSACRREGAENSARFYLPPFQSCMGSFPGLVTFASRHSIRLQSLYGDVVFLRRLCIEPEQLGGLLWRSSSHCSTVDTTKSISYIPLLALKSAFNFSLACFFLGQRVLGGTTFTLVPTCAFSGSPFSHRSRSPSIRLTKS